ncbi:SRPBCC family protein [Mycobacterium sp.]|uniref:SRPBCC family protein n=1 Tax=Mycobacterium sp. TaxID=1785 RepID=UPI002D4078D6|nr:SRPBCC family protein [Mycobacterium sp.]HZA12824.1 SRPBCC family protein [Mycobacterium sp.]
MNARNGRLVVDGDRAVLNFERRLPYPIEAVWSAITEPGERRQWMGETTIDGREGGVIDMVPSGPPFPPEHKRMTGRILVWDPPHVLEHEWKQSIVEDSVVRYELSSDGDETLLRFSHRGLSVRNATGFLPGTHAFLDRLEAHLGGERLPNWSARYQEVAQSMRLEMNQHATQRL